MRQVRSAPAEALAAAVRDMRSLLRSDERVLKSLHRRVFVHRLTLDGVELLISCYFEVRASSPKPTPLPARARLRAAHSAAAAERRGGGGAA